MTIKPVQMTAPQPNTERAQGVQLTYDPIRDRIAYPSGNSIIVRSVDVDSTDIPVRQFTKHIHTTTVATFSPSGNYIASGDVTGQIKIWDTAVVANSDVSSFDQPYIKSEFQILSGPIKSIAWDGDNSRVIGVGEGKDKYGHCFTWDSGNSIGEIQGHSATVYSVDIKSQRPYRAATAGEDKALVFYKGPPFKFDKSVRDYHTNTIRQVKFSPDGKWLISVGSDRSIVVYDGATGDYVNKIEQAHQGGIFGISWLPNSQEFVTCSADKTLKQWNIDDLKLVETYIVDEDSKSIENHQLGVVVTKNFIISLSYNGNLNYFKLGNPKPVEILLGNQKGLTSVKLIGDQVLTGGATGKIFHRQLSNLSLNPLAKQLGDSQTSHSNLIAKILDVDHQTLTIGWDDKLKIWDNNTSELVQSVDLSSQPKQLVAYNQNIIILFENKLELYDSKLNKIGEQQLNFSATDFDLVPSSSYLLILNGTKNVVEEYSIGSDSISASESKYAPLRSQPTLIRVSPEGQYAAVADSTGKYTLYDTSKGSSVSTRWAFHTSRVYDAKWTPDSKYLVSVGLDNVILLYSVAKPSKVLKFPSAHQNGVSGVEWTQYDGKSGEIVTIGMDGFTKTWSIDFSAY